MKMNSSMAGGLSVLLLLLTSLSAFGEELKLPPMHHSVRVAIPEGMQIGDQVRLNEHNEIDCISCHGTEDLAGIPLEQVDREAPDFFVDGPYRKMGDLCARCHDAKESERPNIHILFDDDGELIEDRCLFCHLEVPDTRSEVIAGQENESAKLRLPAGKLCFGCHLKTPHLNASSHLKEMPAKPPLDMVKFLGQQSRKGGYRLPLSDGFITCVTCHTPHQRGVVKPGAGVREPVEDRPLEEGIGYAEHPWSRVVAADKSERIAALAARSMAAAGSSDWLEKQLQYRRLTHEVLLRAPAKDGTLCLLCHRFEN